MVAAKDPASGDDLVSEERRHKSEANDPSTVPRHTWSERKRQGGTCPAADNKVLRITVSRPNRKGGELAAEPLK